MRELSSPFLLQPHHIYSCNKHSTQNPFWNSPSQQPGIPATHPMHSQNAKLRASEAFHWRIDSCWCTLRCELCTQKPVGTMITGVGSRSARNQKCLTTETTRVRGPAVHLEKEKRMTVNVGRRCQVSNHRNLHLAASLISTSTLKPPCANQQAHRRRIDGEREDPMWADRELAGERKWEIPAREKGGWAWIRLGPGVDENFGQLRKESRARPKPKQDVRAASPFYRDTYHASVTPILSRSRVMEGKVLSFVELLGISYHFLCNMLLSPPNVIRDLTIVWS